MIARAALCCLSNKQDRIFSLFPKKAVYCTLKPRVEEHKSAPGGIRGMLARQQLKKRRGW